MTVNNVAILIASCFLSRPVAIKLFIYCDVKNFQSLLRSLFTFIGQGIGSSVRITAILKCN